MAPPRACPEPVEGRWGRGVRKVRNPIVELYAANFPSRRWI